VSATAVAVVTLTAQTASVTAWEVALATLANDTMPAAAISLASAHAAREAAAAADWNRSFVLVGGTAPVKPPSSNYTVHAGTIGDQHAFLDPDFACQTPESCPGEAAARCDQLQPQCKSFAIDPAWSVAAQLYTTPYGPTTQKNPAWTLWSRDGGTSSDNPTSVAEARLIGGHFADDHGNGPSDDRDYSDGNRTAVPFALNQNYVLFRYLQRIQANGSSAIHFNGVYNPSVLCCSLQCGVRAAFPFIWKGALGGEAKDNEGGGEGKGGEGGFQAILHSDTSRLSGGQTSRCLRLATVHPQFKCT